LTKKPAFSVLVTIPQDVRFMQNEDALAVLTEPPAIAVFALVDLAYCSAP
jgi:hypothetical protein